MSKSVLKASLNTARRLLYVSASYFVYPTRPLLILSSKQFADVGDQVVFTFHQKNHTATQSSLAAPCSLVDGGLDSGL